MIRRGSRFATPLRAAALAVLAPALVSCAGVAPAPKPQAVSATSTKAGPFARVVLPKDARVVWATYRETWRDERVEEPRPGAPRTRPMLKQRALVSLELLRPDATGYVAPPPAAPEVAPETGARVLVRVHAFAFGPRLAATSWDSHDFEDVPSPRANPPLEGPIAAAPAGCETFGAIDAFLRDFPNVAVKTGMGRPEFEARALPILAMLLESLVAGMPTPHDPNEPTDPDATQPPPPAPTCEGRGTTYEAFVDALGRLKSWPTPSYSYSSGDSTDDGDQAGAPVDAARYPFADPAQRWTAVLRAFRRGPELGPTIEAALKGGDVATRRAALLAAWSVGGPASLTSAVLATASDPDASVRAYAWLALGTLEAPKRDAVPALLELLRKGDAATRERVLSLIYGMGEEARPMAPKLGELANGADEPLALSSLGVLQRLGAHAVDALPALRITLDSTSVDRRRAALSVLSSLRVAAKALTPAVIARMKDPDDGIRMFACAVLADLAPDPKLAVPALGEALGDKSSGVRRAAAGALRPMAADAVALLPKLSPLLEDMDPSTRAQAARTLGAFGAKAAGVVPALIKHLETDPNHSVKDAALEALGAIGPLAKAALPAVMTVVKGQDEMLRRTAIHAAIDLGPSAAGEIPVLLEAARKVSAWFATGALERMGHKMGRAAAPALVKLLVHDDRDVRRGAARGLGALGKDGGPEVPKLLERIDDDSLRREIFGALRSIGPAAAAAVPKLVEMLTKPAYRSEAFQTLSKIGGPAIAALTAIMQDKKRPTDLRQGAANAILEAGAPAASSTLAVLEAIDELGSPSWVLSGFERVGKAAVAPLVAAAHDKRPAIRSLAISALGRISGDGKKEAIVALLGLMKDPETASAARRAIDDLGKSRASAVMTEVLADKSKADLHEYAQSFADKWK
jgi:HEAT repeat protein